METVPYEHLNDVRVVTGGQFGMPHGATLDSDGNLWVLSNGFGGGVYESVYTFLCLEHHTRDNLIIQKYVT